MNMHKRSAERERNAKSAKDIYAMRKRKKRRKVFYQCIWLLLLSMATLILYQRRDSWIPKLETMGIRNRTYRQGTGSETDGEFLIDLYGNADYQAGQISGRLLLLCDSYLFLYDTDGTQIASRQHAYGNAMLRTSGEYALIYEYGGTNFRLETAAKERYEKKVTDPIIFGRVSPDGQIALVTGAENCACRLLVFNAKGQQYYKRDCVERIVDVSFRAQGGGCYTVSAEASGGSMHSVLHSYDFSQPEDLWSSQPLDMLAISVYNTSEGNLFLFGDTKCCCLDPNGTVLSSYTYPDKLIRSCFYGNTAAMLFGNDETRTKSVVVINGSSGTPAVRTYEKDVRDIGLMTENEALIVQLRKETETLSYQCNVLQTTPLDDSYDGFLRIGQNLFLKGYDHIDRLEYHAP